jgi:hypothetical protein
MKRQTAASTPTSRSGSKTTIRRLLRSSKKWRPRKTLAGADCVRLSRRYPDWEQLTSRCIARLFTSLRSELDQTPAGCDRDGFGAADNVEFGENAADVRLHGAVADK